MLLTMVWILEVTKKLKSKSTLMGILSTGVYARSVDNAMLGDHARLDAHADASAKNCDI